jgi:uncharacterized protein (DUF2147 family)
MMFLLSILASGALASGGVGDSAIGRWQTETKHGVVEVTACGQSICGRLLESDKIRTNPQLRDEKNKDPAQRDRVLKGLLMLQGFKAHNGQWTDGTIYNADDGGTYQGTLTMVDRDTLKVKGCIVWPLCKSQIWKRAK